ncbi:hypothetical protein B0H15DRAFT_797963 [Mycena belliarum]|uniref:Uncharacterized protein n=1 Tax=Mycena belliarum TaxID=1033014 RepID=A0AAD6XUU7_9AGAR|nr:hypothetical protein B0H15DRAFT_797963 [Mycena belliae]
MASLFAVRYMSVFSGGSHGVTDELQAVYLGFCCVGISNGCNVPVKPWVIPFAVGAQAIFNLFLIILTICNALDRPYQRQADVVTALINDGIRMFLCTFCEQHAENGVMKPH